MKETNFKSLDSLYISQKIIPLKMIKILIIEDCPIQANVIKISLEDLGIINITLAASAEEAIKLFSENFDLMIADLHLPNMNGIEVSHHYRTIFPKKDTPIICCSSDVDNHRRECIEAGMDDFLDKPIMPDTLKKILECWLPSYNCDSLKQTNSDLVSKEYP